MTITVERTGMALKEPLRTKIVVVDETLFATLSQAERLVRRR